MIQPCDVPRLPVLDWQVLGIASAEQVHSVVDGSEHIFTSSGRAAIMLGLELLGVSQGDQVLVPTYHCPTMVAPIIAIGAVPLFYPISEKGEALLQQLVLPDPNRIKAAIVPHFFGIPQDLSWIRGFCDQHSIALIEDCAHCFFGTGGGRTVGHWGDVAIASLTKFFPVPTGGILVFPQGVGQQPRLQLPGLKRELKAIVDILETAVAARRLLGLRAIFRGVFSLKRSMRKKALGGDIAPQFSDVVAPEALDFDVVQAHRAPERICCWMPSIIDRVRLAERRQQNYRKLSAALSGHHGFSPLFPTLPADAVPYVFPLRVNQPSSKYHKLKVLGLPVFRWNWLWPGTPAIAGDSGLTWSSEVFQLACHQELTDEELECICLTVIRICSEPAAG